jgi:hypothetical protein
MTDAPITYEEVRDAVAEIKSLMTHTDACGPRHTPEPPYPPDDIHDAHSTLLRDLMTYLVDGGMTDDRLRDEIEGEYFPAPMTLDQAKHLRDLLDKVWRGCDEFDWMREVITEWALSDSLCPIHFCDYAMCFEDDDPECATIRLIHPSHDT